MERKKSPIDEIISDVKIKYKKSVKEFADEIAFEIEKAYEGVVEMFYSDYEPRVYNRTYSTYLGSNAYDDIFRNGVTQYGNSFFSGINVSESNIPGNPYKAYKGWVFNRTFYKGIHGMNRNDLIRINKPKSRENMVHVKYKPKNMTPAPVKLMDREFKKLTKKQNLDRKFEEIFNNNMQ